MVVERPAPPRQCPGPLVAGRPSEPRLAVGLDLPREVGQRRSAEDPLPVAVAPLPVAVDPLPVAVDR